MFHRLRRVLAKAIAPAGGLPTGSVFEKLELGPDDRLAVFIPGVLTEDACARARATIEEAWKLPHKVVIFEDGVQLQVLKDGGGDNAPS